MPKVAFLDSPHTTRGKARTQVICLPLKLSRGKLLKLQYIPDERSLNLIIPEFNVE